MVTFSAISAYTQAQDRMPPASGVEYEDLKPEDMVLVNLDGEVVEGKYRPSSDTATHLELYKKYDNIGGVVHTHSTYAVAWAQAGRDIPLYGTTHADYFCGTIPCTRNLTEKEIDEAYEVNTGKVIIETFEDRGINTKYVPGVICKNHGPFTWGKDADQAVYNAVVLEEVAKMALFTEQVNPQVQPAPDCIRDKHFNRKHGGFFNGAGPGCCHIVAFFGVTVVCLPDQRVRPELSVFDIKRRTIKYNQTGSVRNYSAACTIIPVVRVLAPRLHTLGLQDNDTDGSSEFIAYWITITIKLHVTLVLKQQFSQVFRVNLVILHRGFGLVAILIEDSRSSRTSLGSVNVVILHREKPSISFDLN